MVEIQQLLLEDLEGKYEVRDETNQLNEGSLFANKEARLSTLKIWHETRTKKILHIQKNKVVQLMNFHRNYHLNIVKTHRDDREEYSRFIVVNYIDDLYRLDTPTYTYYFVNAEFGYLNVFLQNSVITGKLWKITPMGEYFMQIIAYSGLSPDSKEFVPRSPEIPDTPGTPETRETRGTFEFMKHNGKLIVH